MPSETPPQQTYYELFAAIGILLTLAYLLVRIGAIPGKRMKTAPKRLVELSLMDIAAVFLLYFSGQIIFSVIDQLLEGPLSSQVAGMNVGYRGGLWHLLAQLLTQGLPVCYLLIRLHSDSDFRKFGFGSYDGEKESGDALWGLLLIFLLVMPTNVIGIQFAQFFNLETPQIAHNLLRQMQTGTSALPLQIISAILLAPILEEIIFRGILQTAMLNAFCDKDNILEFHPIRSRWTAIIIASAIFSVVHYPGVPFYILPSLFILGVLLGWHYETTGTLWPCIFMHAAFNAVNTGVVLNPQLFQTSPT